MGDGDGEGLLSALLPVLGRPPPPGAAGRLAAEPGEPGLPVMAPCGESTPSDQIEG